MTDPNLRFPAISCKNHCFPPKLCGLLRLQALEFPEGVNLRKSAVFCDNLRFGAWSVTLSPSPYKIPREKSGAKPATLRKHSESLGFIRLEIPQTLEKHIPCAEETVSELCYTHMVGTASFFGGSKSSQCWGHL